MSTTNPTPEPTTPSGGAALPLPTAEPCASCGTTGGAHETPGPKPIRTRGLCNRCYLHHTRYGTLDLIAPPDNNQRRIDAAHRAAQVRVALREQREERRRAAQVHTFVRTHPELFAPEALRALFAGPVVARGEAYWCGADAAREVAA